MKRIIPILLLCFAVTAQAVMTEQDAEAVYRDTAMKMKHEIELGGLPTAAVYVDGQLDSMIRVAVVNLRAGDHDAQDLAMQVEWDWNNYYHGYLPAVTGLEGIGITDIGDHAPLSHWLAETYDKIEASLGVGTCKLLHISDIKTFNFAIPVVFRPCSFPMDAVTIDREHEYRNHFCKGGVYYGLIPVTLWWTISIGCWTGTSGVGSFLCAIAASSAEAFMGDVIGPRLSDDIYERVCNQ